MAEREKLQRNLGEENGNNNSRGGDDGRDETVMLSKDSEMINEAMKEENIYASNCSISNLSSNSVIDVVHLEDTWNTSHDNDIKTNQKVKI